MSSGLKYHEENQEMERTDRSKSPLSLPASVVRNLDRQTIEDVGIPGLILMENAGQGAAQTALSLMLSRGLCKVLLLAGRGNNAGDAFVVARHLKNAHMEPRILLVDDQHAFPPGSDAAENLRFAGATGVEILRLSPETIVKTISDSPKGETLLVDGLLGTGIAGAPRPPFDLIIQGANNSHHPICALDLPSGLNADTGEVVSVAIRAHTTITFGVAKPGLFKQGGPEHAGQVVVQPISIPAFLIDRALRAQSEKPS